MTRLFSDGAEMGDIMFWDWHHSTSSLAVASVPVPVGGTYSYSGCWLGAYKLLDSPPSEFYMRYRVRTTTNEQTVGASILGWRYGTESAGRITLDPLKRISFYSDGLYVPSSPGIVMQNNTWYLMEVHVIIDHTSGQIEFFIDGEQYLDWSGDTDPYSNTFVDNIIFETNAYTTVYIDDLALNDTNGSVDNTWCGDGIVVKMTPDGNGADNDWDGSDGNQVDNYLLVDEYPKDDDSTYVMCDGSSSGTQDQYTLTDLDYTNKTVLRIWPEARARETASSAYTLKLGILPSGGVDDVSAGRALFSGYYGRVIGDEYLVNPFDSNPWDELSLDPLQFIAEVG